MTYKDLSISSEDIVFIYMELRIGESAVNFRFLNAENVKDYLHLEEQLRIPSCRISVET